MLKPYTLTPKYQHGVVLLITLIVLVAMTLAGLALTRSVDTNNVIVGNLAFRQAAVQSADLGMEAAVDWLELQGINLQNQIGNASYYFPVRQDPLPNQTWHEFWEQVLVPAGGVRNLAEDPNTGNSLSYVIHRLCNGVGPPNAVGVECSVPPVEDNDGSSKSALVIELKVSTKVYYRITVRVTGPRNTLSYVQAIVAI